MLFLLIFILIEIYKITVENRKLKIFDFFSVWGTLKNTFCSAFMTIKLVFYMPYFLFFLKHFMMLRKRLLKQKVLKIATYVYITFSFNLIILTR